MAGKAKKLVQITQKDVNCLFEMIKYMQAEGVGDLKNAFELMSKLQKLKDEY